MKTQTTIMVLGVIAAASLISVAVISENATQYSVVSTQASQGFQMLGHLEMVAHDPDGNIIQYVQTDNAIQEQGVNCIVQELFATGLGSGNCAGGTNGVGVFDVIEIGTGTGQGLDQTGLSATTALVGTNPAQDGDGVSINDTDTLNLAAGANGTISVNFVATAAVIITEAVLLNSTGTDEVALAYRDFNDINLDTNDSLTVEWVITVLESVS